MRDLVAQVQRLDPDSRDFAIRARVLMEAVLNHVAEEEGVMFMEALQSVGERGVRAASQADRKIA